MNERIKELISEAGFGLGSFGFDSDPEMACGSVNDLAKFAELIVRECAKALDDKLANPNGASMAYCDGSDLLEHFGVEE